ncbi:MAG: alpha/beta hydrolase [Cytophagales bacterium]|nr:MAG: alpha/beta hydrolase [Cytophagales bacterium]
MNQPIILVHGAWMDASAWAQVTPLLEQEGHSVTTVNLPGHGADNTPYEQIQLASYVEVVKNVIGGQTNVILVGHSMAGMVISQVAEAIPTQLNRLVYVAAYLPQNGESLYGLSQQDKDSHIGKFWRQDDPAHYSPAYIAAEGIAECFCADCDEATAQHLIDTHKPDALAPLATPVSLTDDAFGSVKKVYIHTEQDNAVSFYLQQLMVSRSNVGTVFSLPTSHSPFFSQPTALANLILTE